MGANGTDEKERSSKYASRNWSCAGKTWTVQRLTCTTARKPRQDTEKKRKPSQHTRIHTHTLHYRRLARCTEKQAYYGSRGVAAAVQMLAALFHIHSTALSRITVHWLPQTLICAQTHAYTQYISRATYAKRERVRGKQQCTFQCQTRSRLSISTMKNMPSSLFFISVSKLNVF